MRKFQEIWAIAAARHGGDAALEVQLPHPLGPEDLRQSGDDRWLSAMAKCLFQAGFNWSVIERKWPAFENAFDGFRPEAVAGYGAADLARLLATPEIVRNRAKISAVISNAQFLVGLARGNGSAAQVFADWPGEEFVGLLRLVEREGARLGGLTGQRVFRAMGRDGFLMSPDVVRRLELEGVIASAPTSKRAMDAAQVAFNAWQAQSGRSFSEISRVLALSVGEGVEGA